MNRKNKVRDFELLAIERMLDEITSPPSHPEMMGRLGDYEIEKVIGYGGMGVVLRAYDRELRRPVAIKLIMPRLAHDGIVKQRFAREARAAAAILHPNVIAIHGIDETKGMPWFVMPLINGPSLRELVEQKGALNERDIVRIGLQIASGLAAAHSHGVIHRDIKPENILVDNQINRVAITDFGLARQEFDATLTQSGILAGTLNYMSPEQARGEDMDARSDLFSLGSLLYFLATGTAPFRSDSPGGVIHMVVNEKQKDARALNPEISVTLARTIDSLLEKNPDHRFQSAVELEGYLAQLVSYLNQPTKNELPNLPVTKRDRHAKWLSLVALAVLSITVTCAYWFNLPGPERVTPQHLWTEIQQKYELETPKELLNQMSGLDQKMSALSRQLFAGESQEHDTLNRDLLQIGREIRSLGQQLEFGSQEGPAR